MSGRSRPGPRLPVSPSPRASPCHTGQFYGGEAPAPSPPVFPQHGHRSQGRTGQGRWPTRTSGLRRLPLAPLLQGSLQSPRRAHLSCLLGLRSAAVLSLAWSFTTVTVLESAGCCLVECASVRVCLMVLSGKAEVPLCPPQGSTSGARGALLSFDGEADLGRLAGWCPPGSSAVKSLLLPPAERTPCGWDLAAPVPSDGARSPERPPWVS